MAKYSIREVHDNDLSGIARLRTGIKEFVPIDINEYKLFWNSLIRDNPCAILKVLVAENDQDEIVAHYAMVPFKFHKNETLLLGGFLCQLMIDENYRQELIFPRMEMQFIKGYKKSGIDFAYSLGNRAHVVKAHLSFGFCKIGELPVHAKPYKLTKIAPHIIKSNLLNLLISPGLYFIEKIIRFKRTLNMGELKLIEISRFNTDIDQFLLKVQKHFQYIAVRNASILNWRFVDSHKKTYQILVVKEKEDIIGYVVLRCMNMKQFYVLAIVDILFFPDRYDAGKALLTAVHEISLRSNVDMTTCLLNTHDPLYPTLKKCGYFRTPETFSLFTHEPKDTKDPFRDDSFHKWHLTWFDNDAV